MLVKKSMNKTMVVSDQRGIEIKRKQKLTFFNATAGDAIKAR